MTERRTLLGALWDRQAGRALTCPTEGPHLRRSLQHPLTEVDERTSTRGEHSDGPPRTAVRGEAMAVQRPPRPRPPEPVTKVRGESVYAGNPDTRDRGEHPNVRTSTV